MGVFDSHEAKNWLKQWLAVFTTWTAILPFVKIEAQQLHTYLLSLAAKQSPCSLDHGKVTNKSQIGCRFHETFRDEILLLHKQQPSWRNAPTDTWHNDEFAIAKLFMQPSGYDDKTIFEQVDFNGIAAFISNCGRFSATTESLSDPARDSTNKIRHMPDICSSALKDQATTDYIDTLAKLLNDPKFNGGKDVQEALKQLAELKTTFPELLGEHWKFIIEDIATKCLQDIHDLCKDEKEIWRKEADQKRADFQFLGDNILSKLTAKGETVLGDIKKLMEISQKTIVNSIGDGIKQIEARTEIGERTIYERTETGYQKLDNKTKIGERKIDEKTEKRKTNDPGKN